MKKSFCLLYMLFIVLSTYANVYVVIYATNNGHTGHCGLAIDDYYIRVLESKNECQTSTYDTVRTGTLVYFDLWPFKDEYKGNYEGDIAPKYYKLPSARYNQYISVKTLSDQGIPHKYNAPVDGLLAYASTKRQDFEIRKYMDDLMDSNKSFNAMHYNCGDFVLAGINHLLGVQLSAKEYVIKDYVTTPNEIYKVLSSRKDFDIVKDPGDKIKGSFVYERIFAQVPVFQFFQLFTLIPSLL